MATASLCTMADAFRTTSSSEPDTAVYRSGRSAQTCPRSSCNITACTHLAEAPALYGGPWSHASGRHARIRNKPGDVAEADPLMNEVSPAARVRRLSTSGGTSKPSASRSHPPLQESRRPAQAAEVPQKMVFSRRWPRNPGSRCHPAWYPDHQPNCTRHRRNGRTSTDQEAGRAKETTWSLCSSFCNVGQTSSKYRRSEVLMAQLSLA